MRKNIADYFSKNFNCHLSFDSLTSIRTSISEFSMRPSSDSTQTTGIASSHLLKFQIGPVQDFIAQARSTRDLWSGSYLLSWLVASGIRKCVELGGHLIFPCSEGGIQPLLNLPSLPEDGIHSALLTPNLPNIFIARFPADPTAEAKKISDEIENQWKAIAEAVWDRRNLFDLPLDAKKRFDAQVDRHLSIAWQATKEVGADDATAYREAYRHNGWFLDAVRQTRNFTAWESADGIKEKDSLSGKEEALLGGNEKDDDGLTYKDRMAARADAWKVQKEGAYPKLFSKHTDYLGAVAIIKRVWHLACLKEKWNLKTAAAEHRIRSIPAIAARKETHDDEETGSETAGGDKYIAAIAFDGDAIGSWVNGDKSPNDVDLRAHHADFSRFLSNFALGEVHRIVEGSKDERARGLWKGQLIYAGGDDVVCLVPADIAIKVASELRQAFCAATLNTKGNGEKPDASAGIVIGHIHAPLQDLIREAQLAEKRAKNEVGRPAFSVTLMKRSGEISHWGSQWATGGLELYNEVDTLLQSNKLSAKFPHRVCQLLEPYLTRRSSLSKQTDAIQSDTEAREIITREFFHAAERQGSKEIAEQLDGFLNTYLEGVLTSRTAREEKSGKPTKQSVVQELFTSVIGLCTTVAFANRDRDTEPTA